MVFLPALLRHAANCDAAYTERLLERAGVGQEELIALIRALLPEFDLSIGNAELDRILPRWENNASIRKTVGEVTIGQIRRIFAELFPPREARR